MKKFKSTLIFYGISAIVVYVLTLISPDQHDGGPGFGTLALGILVLVILGLAIYNLIKGFRSDKIHFIIATIHIIIFLIMVKTLFL